jgi:uncharacterized protein YcgI (DUF1989 family)
MRVRMPDSPAASAAPDRNDKPPEATPLQNFCTNRRLTKTIVQSGHGYAFHIGKGARFRIIDLHGEQVVDLFAWVHDPIRSLPASERLSVAYTRYHLSGVTPAIGEHLYTNGDRKLLRVTADTVKVHDMTFMACFPEMYRKKGLKGHRSCAQNVVEAMDKAGWGGSCKSVLEVPEPFNCFQNTPNYSLKALGSSKPGDYVEFEALEDIVVAVSCCPYELDGFNGGCITDVAVVISEEKK